MLSNRHISRMGYRDDSPYRDRSFIDIHTPQGLIDMSQTGIPLLAQDETGIQKVLPPYSGMHKFRGQRVREIPMAQRGGFSSELYNYIFEDQEEEPEEKAPTAPSAAQIAPQRMVPQRTKEEDLALQIALSAMDEEKSFPSSHGSRTTATGGVNPYLLKTQQDLFQNYHLKNLGIWGDKAHQARRSDHNTGDAQDLGFDTPETASSVVSRLQSEAADRNVKYIIYNGKIWNPSVSQDWRPYSGPNPHSSHIHVSYNRRLGGKTNDYRPKH